MGRPDGTSGRSAIANPLTVKQRVLGAVYAAPSGITRLTLETLMLDPDADIVGPRALQSLLVGYRKAGWVRIIDGVYYPGAKLADEVAKWTTIARGEIQPRAVRRDPTKRTVGVDTLPHAKRRAIIDAFMFTTHSNKRIARDHGVSIYLVDRVIRSSLAPDEYAERVEERRIDRTMSSEAEHAEPMHTRVARAVEMYMTTTTTVADIAATCGLRPKQTPGIIARDVGATVYADRRTERAQQRIL